MKKIALVSAVAIASVSAAQAAPTVYGKAFLTADYMDTNYDSNYRNASSTTKAPADDSTVKLNSNASRIGIKGSEGLTANTDVIYQLEYGVDIDTDSNNRVGNQQFYARNTYLGVANKQYGTLTAGRNDTPFKIVNNIDVFTMNAATLSMDRTGPALGNVTVNGLTTNNGKTYNLGESRENNIISYTSPKMTNLPLTFMVATKLSEKDNECRTVLTTGKGIGTDNCGNPNGTLYSELNPNKDGYSAAVSYDNNNGIYAAAAYNDNMNGTVEDNAWRVLGSVDLGKMNMVQGLKLGAMYQQANLYNTKDDAKTILVSGKYKVANTPWTAKAQYITTDFGNNDSQEIAVGGEYAFNKSTTGHVYAGQISRDNYKDDTIVGGGIEYKF